MFDSLIAVAGPGRILGEFIREQEVPKRCVPKQFGETLRCLRVRRGLSLGQVAAASRQIATDSAGRISQPYLSQLEAGRARSIALPKLLTLAALYRAEVRELLAAAPDDHHQRLVDDLAKWDAEGRSIPDPVRYLPGEVSEINQGVSDALTTTSKNVRLPLDDQERALRRAREVVMPSVLPVYLLSSHAATIRRFWHDCRTDIEHHSYQRTNPWWWWDSVVSDFQDWLLYEVHAANDLLSGIASWTLDFDSSLASCHFRDAKAEEHFGYSDVPADAVIGVRRVQTARTLSATRPRRSPPVPGLPAPVEGIKLYLSILSHQLPPAALLSHCRALAQRLGVPAATRDQSVTSIATLLQQADNGPAAPPAGERRTPGQARPKRARRKR